ncbi:MAG: DUF177 domain-containing protein [Acidobacteriota bacterium]
MIVDLAENDQWPKNFDVTIDRPGIDLEREDARLAGPVAANGSIEKHAGWFSVSGQVSANVEIDCSRCLDPLKRLLAISFDIRLLDNEVLSGAAEREVEKGDLDLSVIDDERVDMNHIVREQILLELPEQVFCSENCKGLCPKCGSNRNLIDCKCEEDEIDPRWAALMNLK